MSITLPFLKPAEFNGSDYDSQRDRPRLQAQLDAIRDLMKDGEWRTLSAIERTLEAQTGRKFPQASISAQLRHLKKPKFGAWTLDKRYMGSGLYEYRLLTNGRLPL